MRTYLTERQQYVVAVLYVDYSWSATRLARVLGVGRRAVENALRRVGVDVRHRGCRPIPAPLSEAAATAWLADASRNDRAIVIGLPTSTHTAVSGVVTFERRRCQHCDRLNTFQTHCAACGRLLDFYEPEVVHG